MNDAPLDSSFFEGRYLMEITSWDWSLHVGLGPQRSSRKSSLPGGLAYSKTIVVEGRILAPKEERGQSVTVRLTPYGPKIMFGRQRLNEVGKLYFPNGERAKSGFEVSLMIAEADLPTLAIALSSISKYMNLWTYDNFPAEAPDEARVSAYALAARIPERIRSWAGTD